MTVHAGSTSITSDRSLKIQHTVLFSAAVLFLTLGWFLVINQSHTLTKTNIVAYQQTELALVQSVARSAQNYAEYQIGLRGAAAVPAIEQEILTKFIAPVRLLENGDAWIYAPDHVVFDLSSDFPDAYRGKNMAQIFELQKVNGANSYEMMVDSVMNKREGVGSYIWLPEKGQEIAAWTPIFVGDKAWIIGVSTPLPEILTATGASNQIRIAFGLMSLGTLIAIALLAAWIRSAAHRRRTEHALEQSEARLRAVITNVPIALFGLDQQGVVTLDEGKGLSWIGAATGTHVGTSIVDSFAHLQQGAIQVQRALAGEDARWEDGHGDEVYEIRLMPVLDAQGQVQEIVGVGLNISERVRAEEARLALERRLMETQKLEGLGMLAGGVAHDFNNLLAVIMGNASLMLLDLPPDSPAQQQAQQIEITAQRAAELTQQILAYAGKGRYIIQPLDINTLITEMGLLLQTSISRSITLDMRLTHPLPSVEADATQIRQIIMNLVINAAEAIGDTDGTITITTGVRYASREYLTSMYLAPDLPETSYVYLDIADTGCGIDAETLSRIFDPFFTTKFTGRGLGLAAVLGIVRGHKGALKVQSSAGQGTLFTILLPVVQVGAAQARELGQRPTPRVQAPQAQLEPAAPNLETLPLTVTADATALLIEQPTILVVDDDSDVRATVIDMVERCGFAVLTAPDGQAGIALFHSHADQILCVVLDLTMPRMNGRQALELIQHIKPEARVVLMSGYNVEQIAHGFTESEQIRFLQKPFKPDDLRLILQQFSGSNSRVPELVPRDK